MQQDKIWDYFQNEGLEHNQFPEHRQRFVASKLRSTDVVLDIGVGAGALERIAAGRGITMYALDPSEKAIERLRGELGMGDRAQTGYAQQIPFAPDMFDVVVMSELIEHLDNKAIDDILPEVLRVLKPGGYALITTPFDEDFTNKMAVCPDCGKVFHRVGHVQTFTMNRITDLFRHHGYSIKKSYVTTFVDWRRHGLLNKLKAVGRVVFARMGQRFADPHIVLLAEKP